MTRQTEGKQPVAFAAMKQYTGKRSRSMKNFYIATMGADFCRYAKAHDTGIELDQFCMAENLEGVKYENVKQEIMQIMEDSGIGGSDMVLHAPFNELHPAAIDPEALRLARRRMEQAYHVCEDFGIRKMVVHSGYLPHVYFKSWHTERSVEFWTDFMADKPEDFVICIENVLDDEPYMMRDMMEKIREKGGHSNIGICLDTGHANCISDTDVHEWIRTLCPYINHFHIHNNDGEHDLHSTFAEGVLDMQSLLDLAGELCDPGTTYTIEVMECGSAVEWLASQGWLR